MAPTRLITTMHDDGSSELVVECETYVSSTSRGPSAADDVMLPLRISAGDEQWRSCRRSTSRCRSCRSRRSVPVDDHTHRVVTGQPWLTDLAGSTS